MQADAEALAAVQGIGPATAERIRWAVAETGPAYGDPDQVIFHL